MIKLTKYKFLLQHHKNMIYRYSFLMLHNKMDADDVTQEVLIRLWNNIETINLIAGKQWLIRTTHNLCIDYLRKRKLVYQREISIDEFVIENLADTNYMNNPSTQMEIKLAAAKAKEAIQKLPENLKSVFVLYEIEGLKYKEISKALGLPINSVKVYLMRARIKLQEAMKSYEPNEAF